MGKSFRFDPPLQIPGGGGTANIEAMGDLFDPEQPKFIQLTVSSGNGEKLAIGLFEHVEADPGLYRLIDGTAYSTEGVVKAKGAA